MTGKRFPNGKGAGSLPGKGFSKYPAETWMKARQLYMDGLGCPEIGKRLGISRWTVRNHVRIHGWRERREEMRRRDAERMDRMMDEKRLRALEALAEGTARLAERFAGAAAELDRVIVRSGTEARSVETGQVDREGLRELAETARTLAALLLPKERQTVRIELGEEIRELGE